MAQLVNNISEPFGEINISRLANGEIQVSATILMIPDFEDLRVGMALDGSRSMKHLYGGSRAVSSIFGGEPNLVEPVARTMSEYLVKFAHNGEISLIYWACGAGGANIEPIGNIPAARLARQSVTGPQAWGAGTRLLPPLQHFTDKFREITPRGVKEPGAICVFITDGIIEDLDMVINYCYQYAKEIAARKRPFIKLFLLGIGEEVDQTQLERLDNMFDDARLVDHKGVPIDMWDYLLATDMKSLDLVWKEFFGEHTLVSNGSARIYNQAGKLCKEYSDGIPALLKFNLPSGSTAFKLELPGGQLVVQDISTAFSTPGSGWEVR